MPLAGVPPSPSRRWLMRSCDAGGERGRGGCLLSEHPATRLGAMAPQQTSSGFLLSGYLDRLLAAGGGFGTARTFAYRGQAAATWGLRSSAHRRLGQPSGASANGTDLVQRLITYNGELIADFRDKRFDVVNGAAFTDLEVLCQLQHLGSATSLIDFSRNPLVALWFACEEVTTDETPQTDGEVFKVDTTYSLSRDPGRTTHNSTPPTFAEIVTHRLLPPHDLLAWEPPPIASARERVVAQHSILLLGKSLMSANPAPERITVSHADKQQLMDELAAVGISASTLFPDLYGFANTNSVNRAVQQLNPQALLQEGLRGYHKGDAAAARGKLSLYIREQPNDWTARLVLSNAYVDLREYEKALEIFDAATRMNSLNVFEQHTLHINRANTRAAMGDHEAAIRDYGQALKSGAGGLGNTLHFNRGNSYFALDKFQEALDDYERCPGSENAAYNAGNACIALGRLGDAEKKLVEASKSLTGTPTTAQAQETVRNNLQQVRDMMAVVGDGEVEVEARPIQGSDTARFLRIRVTHADQLMDGLRVYPIVGNVGNKGNVGWSIAGEALYTGGEGFAGSDGMAVQIQAESD